MTYLTPEQEEHYRGKARQKLIENQNVWQRIKILAQVDYEAALKKLAELVNLAFGNFRRIFGPLLNDDMWDDPPPPPNKIV